MSNFDETVKNIFDNIDKEPAEKLAEMLKNAWNAEKAWERTANELLLEKMEGLKC